MRPKTAIALAFLALRFVACVQTPFGPGQKPGTAEITIRVGRVGALAKAMRSTDIELDSLFIMLTADDQDTIKDTFMLSGSEAHTITATYEDLASLIPWTLRAKTVDQNSQIIHTGSVEFEVQPKKSTPVELNLDASYSMMRAHFFPIRDSVTRCEFIADGDARAETSFVKQSLLGDTVTVHYDYLETGTTHAITLNVYGDMWGIDTLLYTGSIDVDVVAGKDDKYNIVLQWVGPDTPPPGQTTMVIELGTISTVTVTGKLGDNVNFQVIQITNNTNDDYNPHPSDGKIVWRGYDGSDYEIYLYDGNTVIQLTDNTYNDSDPQISGNNVVWRGSDGVDYEIYLYNGAATINITDNDRNDSDPHVSGNNVAWRGHDGNDYEIFLYTGDTIVNLSNNDQNDNDPRIAGNKVVWRGNDGSDYEIFLYDGVQILQLTDNEYNEYTPEIDGDIVVWRGHDGSDYNIYQFDGKVVSMLSTASTNNSYPSVSNQNIVWRGYDGADYEIYYYDGTSLIQLTDNDYNDAEPNICGQHVVWQSYDGHDGEIFLFDGFQVIQLTDNETDDYDPKVTDTVVVWPGHDGSDYEIYASNL